MNTSIKLIDMVKYVNRKREEIDWLKSQGKEDSVERGMVELSGVRTMIYILANDKDILTNEEEWDEVHGLLRQLLEK